MASKPFPADPHMGSFFANHAWLENPYDKMEVSLGNHKIVDFL